jgi:hypothetical protein
MFNEDLSVFFDDDDFALAGTVSGTEILGIFDREYLNALGIVSGANPVFLVKTSDSAPVNGTLALSGTNYAIRDRQPVDDGATVLLQLEKL